MEKLMDYDDSPFRPGDVVECVSGDENYWMIRDGIKVGDRVIVDECSINVVQFIGRGYAHPTRYFEIIERKDAVEPEYFEESVTPSERLESALKFLETSGDVLQALKIAAGVQ